MRSVEMPPEDDPVESPENPIVTPENDSVEDRSTGNDLNASPEDSPSVPEEETQERTEAQFIAQLAAELATPMPVDDAEEEANVAPSVSDTESEAVAAPSVKAAPHQETESEPIKDSPAVETVSEVAPVVSAEPVISPERLAMRQLQGRMRKNLLLKRPTKAAQEEDEHTSPAENSQTENAAPEESAPVVEVKPAKAPKAPKVSVAESAASVTEPDIDATMELSVLVPPKEDAEATEVGLAAKGTSSTDEDAGLVAKTEPEETETVFPRQIPAAPTVPTVPTRQVIRVEKSSESFTQLHTAIEYAVGNPNFHTDGLMDSSLFQSNRPIVLGVTSAIEGEGKTTVALHLAMDIARNNFKKVCLMDMSLGEDTLSHRLEINTGTGLVNVLEGTEHKLPTIEPAEYEGLSIMPAGKVPDNAARAARSPAVTDVLNAGRKLFDVIIVDMPSITSGNVLPIAPHLDAVVMVVYAGVTPKEVVAGALEKLDKNKVLGVVLNRVRTSMPEWLQKRLNRW